jgi:hypothetical protein
MTERKPPEISFASWIDQQIHEAAERGAFDNLPGAGKPLPNRGRADDQAWLRDYLRREGVSAEDLLPTPLRLRKEIERLTDTVPELASEQQVREVVAELNRQIAEWRRIPLGVPVFLPRVDEETMVRRWREGRSGTPEGRSGTPEGWSGTRRPPVPAGRNGGEPGAPGSRWWHRFSRRGRD